MLCVSVFLRLYSHAPQHPNVLQQPNLPQQPYLATPRASASSGMVNISHASLPKLDEKGDPDIWLDAMEAYLAQREYDERTLQSILKSNFRLLADGLIEPSNSAWASPYFLRRKKGGGYRGVVDLRGVNEQTEPDT